MSISGSIIQMIASLLRLYSLMLGIYVLISWIMHEHHYPPAVRWLQNMVEPVLKPIRRVVPPIGGIDFSVPVAVLIIEMIRSLILY